MTTEKLETSALFKTAEGEAAFFRAYDDTLALWDVPLSSSYVETDFGGTHLLVAGQEDAPPLILLHGFGFGATMWYPNVAAWSRDHRVIAVDVIGEFNRSRTTKSLRTRDDYATWLSQILDALGIEQAVLIGHSNGGWHALNVAMLRPERVRGLVLLAPAASFVHFGWQFPFRLITINVIRTRRTIIDFFGKWMLAKGNQIEPQLFEQFYEGIMHFGWKHKILTPSRYSAAELKTVTAPGLFLVGDQEVIYSTAKAVRAVRKIKPDFEVDVIRDAGHGLSVEQPEHVNSRVLSFLRKFHADGEGEAAPREDPPHPFRG